MLVFDILDGISTIRCKNKVEFITNDFTVQAENFRVTPGGDVYAVGSFYAYSTDTLSRTVIDHDMITVQRYVNGAYANALRMYGEGSTTAQGRFQVYASDGRGGSRVQGSFLGNGTGAQVVLNDAVGNAAIALYANIPSIDCNGTMALRGTEHRTLEVSHDIFCQNINAWDTINAPNLSITGSKNRIVDTSFGIIKMAAFETPEPSFADIGSGKLDKNGECFISIDPRFAETINKKELHWFITPNSECSVWVEKLQNGNCIVHGDANTCFDWICVGSQKGYGDQYAETYEGSDVIRQRYNSQEEYWQDTFLEEEIKKQIIETDNFISETI